MSKPDPKPITEVQLHGWKLLEKFLGVLDEMAGVIAPQRREGHGLRDLDRRAYFGMFLFGLCNAVTDSMRALCSATQLPRVQRLLRIEGPVAISGFSDAQRVFAPKILEPVLSGLLGKSLARNLSHTNIGRISPEVIRVLDSTLWKVIPRMQWAKWRHQHVEQRAVRPIQALLLAEVTGRKPNKRMMELLRWHQLGWASDEELGALLIKEEAARTRRAAAKTKA